MLDSMLSLDEIDTLVAKLKGEIGDDGIRV